jgi:uncharacterized phage infection (PIP) family protein YhgE
MTGASPEPDHFKDREGPEDHESQDQELTSEAEQPADQGDQEEVTEGADVLLDLPVEGSEEYQQLDQELDQIANYLDQLEEKNDSLNERLATLLTEMRENRD